MNTLIHLEESLQREAPALLWHCETPENSQTTSTSGIPQEFDVVAIHAGKPVNGSPFHVSSTTLVRFGIEVMALYICDQLPHDSVHVHSRFGASWDKLADD